MDQDKVPALQLLSYKLKCMTVDRWVEENMVGVVMVDLSVGLHTIDILLENLRIFGLDDLAVLWMTRYMVERSQRMYIDRCLSPLYSALNVEYHKDQS